VSRFRVRSEDARTRGPIPGSLGGRSHPWADSGFARRTLARSPVGRSLTSQTPGRTAPSQPFGAPVGAYVASRTDLLERSVFVGGFSSPLRALLATCCPFGHHRAGRAVETAGREPLAFGRAASGSQSSSDAGFPERGSRGSGRRTDGGTTRVVRLRPAPQSSVGLVGKPAAQSGAASRDGRPRRGTKPMEGTVVEPIRARRHRLFGG